MAQNIAEIIGKTVIRFDSIKLLTRTDGLPKVRRTKEKYLYGEAPVTKTGVFLYRNADGSVRRELRHPDDVFDLESLKSLAGLPVTLDHPPEFVDAANVHKYDKGGTGDNYRIQDKLVIASLTIRHLEAINAVLDGKHELSAAYTAELIFEKGVYEGEEYDCRQVNIRYNHIAIVMWGRAGREVRLRFDSAAELVEEVTGNNEITGDDDTEENNDNINNLKQEEITPMKEEIKIMDENIRFRVDALNAENKQVKTENELLGEKLENTMVKLDCLEKSYKQLSGELAAEKAKRTDSIINSKVDDKVDLLVRAAPYLDDLNAYLRHSPREIMIKVINTKHNDEQDFSDKDDSYIKGKFDSITGAGNKTRRDHAEIFSVLKKHNDHAINGDYSDHMFSLMQDIKQKRITGN